MLYIYIWSICAVIQRLYNLRTYTVSAQYPTRTLLASSPEHENQLTMLFTITNGKFAALLLFASHFATAVAAPARADTAVYDVVEETSVASHVAPVIDASVMFPSGDAAEWAEISAALADVEVFKLEYADADDDALEDISFKPRLRRPIRRPKCPKCPKRPKRRCPKCTKPRCPKCPKSKPRIRLPPLRIRVPIPRINIPGIGRLPLPEHIDIGIASKGGKKGDKGRIPGSRKPLGSDPRTWSPVRKGKGKGKGKDKIDGSRKPRGANPVPARKSKGRAPIDLIIEEEFDFENAHFVDGEIESGQFIVEVVAEDNSDAGIQEMEFEQMSSDDEVADDEEVEVGLGDEGFDFAMEDFGDAEFEELNNTF